MDDAEQLQAGEPERTKRDLFLDQARVRLEQNQARLAMEMAEARLRRLPDDIDARTILCHALIRMGRPDEAREMLRRVEGTLLDFVSLYAVLGDCRLKEGFPKDAAAYYRKFLALNPPDAAAVRQVSGKLDALTGEGDAGRQEDERPLQVGDIAPDFYTVTLADLYLRQGHPEMAVDVLARILEQNPEDAKARSRLREIQAVPEPRPVRRPGRHARTIGTLSRWLVKLEASRPHAS